jgi:hypothetical protein
MICPNCGSPEIRRSQRSSWADIVQQFRGQDAFRCRKCRNRFYALRSAVDDPGSIKPSRRRRSGGKRGLKKRLQFIGTIALVIAACVVTLLWIIQIAVGTKPAPPFDPKDAVAEFASGTWAFPAYTGLRSKPDEKGLTTEFDGTEPEVCRIAEQTVFLPPGDYILTYHYRTAGIQAKSGIRWQIIDSRRDTPLAESSELVSDHMSESSMFFSIPKDSALLRLRLAYWHSPGTKPVNGTLFVEAPQISLRSATGQ